MSGSSNNNWLDDWSSGDGAEALESKLFMGRRVGSGSVIQGILFLSRVGFRGIVTILRGVVAIVVDIGVPVILLLVLLVCVPYGLVVDRSVVDGCGMRDGSGVMHGLTIDGRVDNSLVENVIEFLLVGGEGVTGSADLEADHTSSENSACEVHFSVLGLVFFIIII